MSEVMSIVNSTHPHSFMFKFVGKHQNSWLSFWRNTLDKLASHWVQVLNTTSASVWHVCLIRLFFWIFSKRNFVMWSNQPLSLKDAFVCTLLLLGCLLGNELQILLFSLLISSLCLFPTFPLESLFGFMTCYYNLLQFFLFFIFPGHLFCVTVQLYSLSPGWLTSMMIAEIGSIFPYIEKKSSINWNDETILKYED